jgi:hypothetical protein
MNSKFFFIHLINSDIFGSSGCGAGEGGKGREESSVRMR